MNLDKSYPYYTEAYGILKKTGTLQQAIFKTKEPYQSVRKRYDSILDSITFMPSVAINAPSARKIIDKYQKEISPVAFEIDYPVDTSAILRDNNFIRARGAKIWMNSLRPSLNGGHDDTIAWEDGNTKDSWEWLIAHGATIIQTDRPQMLLNYLRKRSLHN